MIQSLLKIRALPQVPAQAIVATTTLAAFSSLLLLDLIQPVAIVLFQIFLAF